MSDLFASAGLAPPRPSWRPPEPILRRALVEGSYRRWLYRGWGSGPCAFWGMLNPSEASGQRDDPTLWQIMKVSFRLGFGSLYVGNVYPLISPHPAEMRRWRATFEEEPGEEGSWGAFTRNIVDVAEVCRKCDVHFAAWGDGLPNHNDLRLWLDRLDDVLQSPIAWRCFGLTKSGMPKHPLARGRHRIPEDARPCAWERP